MTNMNLDSEMNSNIVLMSMRPEYVEKIFRGDKRYEFRKKKFGRRVEKVMIYATKPLGQIVGHFTFDEVLIGKPSEIWKLCSEYAGIIEEDFYKYFGRYKKAFAIKINKVFRMNKPINPFDAIEGFKSPRSFIYINKNDFSRLIGH